MRATRIGVARLLIVSGLLVLTLGSARAQDTGSFTADPTSGPIGTEVTIDGDCGTATGGDAVALYRVADEALVDAEVRIGNVTGAEPSTWQATLVVEPRLDTAAGADAEPTTDGDYELRLFCGIGSSFREPAFGGVEPELVTAVSAFTVGEPEEAPAEPDGDDGAAGPSADDDDDDPVPTLTRLIPSADEVDWSVERVATNALLALALVALLPFPAGLFNSTFEANYDEIRGWLPGRRKEPSSPAASRSLVPGFALLVLVSALLQSFLDPDLSFDSAGAVLLVGLALSITATTVMAVLPSAVANRRQADSSGDVKLFPLALLIAATCVVISRVADFEPGYLYGLVAGITFGAAASRAATGRMALRTTAFLLVMSAVAFVLRIPVADAASDGDVSVPLALLDTVLAAVFAAGVGADVINLLPLRFLPGDDLFKWKRSAWGAMAALVLFGFLQTLSSAVGSRAPDDSIRLAVILFAVFGAGSIAFWGFFRLRGTGSSG